MPADIGTRIENAIAILTAAAARASPEVRRDLQLSVETLGAARERIHDLEAELDLVTSPDLRAAEQAQQLGHELDAAKLRLAGLEQDVADLRDRLRAESEMHEEEAKRASALAKRNAALESVVGSDDAAFGRFMDRALDEDERKGRL